MDSPVGQAVIVVDPDTGRVLASGLCTEQSTGDDGTTYLTVHQHPTPDTRHTDRQRQVAS